MKGILIKAELLPAKLRVLESGEAQTRRIEKALREINQEPNAWYLVATFDGDTLFRFGSDKYDKDILVKPRYSLGETVYIKEVFCQSCYKDGLKNDDGQFFVCYKADLGSQWEGKNPCAEGKWSSPLFMPEWAARYFITITDVRVERVQEITEEDAKAEGCTMMVGVTAGGNMGLASARYAFKELWDSINPKYPWESNPWVPKYSFKKAE